MSQVVEQAQAPRSNRGGRGGEEGEEEEDRNSLRFSKLELT
jgi:hypothetical protein